VAADVLLESATGLLGLRGVAPHVVDWLERVADDPSADRRALVASLAHLLRLRRDSLPSEVADRLQRLDIRLRGSDFPGRLQRFISLHVQDDDIDQEGNITCQSDKDIETLAEQAVACPELLETELAWLVTDRSDRSHPFGRQLGRRDPAAAWLGPILRAQEAAGAAGTALFLGGYLAAHFNRDPAWWEATILRLAAVSTLRRLFCEIVFRSGLTERVARHMIELAENREIEVRQFGLWLLGISIHALPPDAVSRLLALLVGDGTEESIALALALCDAYYCHERAGTPLPEEEAFILLTHNALFGERSSALDRFNYHWSKVASRFLDLYAHRALDLLSSALGNCGPSGRTLLSVCSHAGPVLERIVKTSPEESWGRIAAVLRDLDSPLAFHLRHWLAGDMECGEDDVSGAVMLFPTWCLWDWVDCEPRARARWLAGTLPRTLDQSASGSLTRAFLCRYGGMDEVARDLLLHFAYRGWCGSKSEHLRALRDQARTWRESEEDVQVVAWINQYMRWLDASIEQAQVEEEREH
jgi:hypothetical protein